MVCQWHYFGEYLANHFNIDITSMHETHIDTKSPHLVSQNVMEPFQRIFGQAIWGPTNIYAHIFDDIWSGLIFVMKYVMVQILLKFTSSEKKRK